MPSPNDNVMGANSDVFTIPVGFDIQANTSDIGVFHKVVDDFRNSTDAVARTMSSQYDSLKEHLNKASDELHQRLTQYEKDLEEQSKKRTSALKQEFQSAESVLTVRKATNEVEKEMATRATSTTTTGGGGGGGGGGRPTYTLGESGGHGHAPQNPEEVKSSVLQHLAARLPGSGIGGLLREVGAGGKIPGILGDVLGPSSAAVASELLPAAGVAGAAYGAYTVGSIPFQQAQQYTAATGGTSVAGAAGYNLQARIMAVSPFISDQQARQVIQQTLQAGYTGNQAQTVMDMVTKNFESMGISIGNSLAMYKSNVVDAGASTDALSASLDSLKKTAAGTQASAPALYQNFQQASQTLSAQGAGKLTPSVAGLLSQQFAGGPTTTANMSLASMYNTPQGQAMIATMGLGVAPTQLFGQMQRMSKAGSAGTEAEAQLPAAVLTKMLNNMGLANGTTQDQLDDPSAGGKLMAFQQFASQLTGQQWSPEQTAQMAFNLLNPNASGTSLQQTIQRQQQQSSAKKLSKSPLAENIHGVQATGRFLSNTVLSQVHGLGNFFGIGSKESTRQHQAEAWYQQSILGSNTTDPLVEELLSGGTNLGNLHVSSNGKVQSFMDFIKKDKNAFGKLQAGSVSVGTGKDASQFQKLSAYQGSSGLAIQQQGGVQGGQMLDLTPQAAQLVKLLNPGTNASYNSSIQSQALIGTNQTNNQYLP